MDLEIDEIRDEEKKAKAGTLVANGVEARSSKSSSRIVVRTFFALEYLTTLGNPSLALCSSVVQPCALPL